MTSKSSLYAVYSTDRVLKCLACVVWSIVLCTLLCSIVFLLLGWWNVWNGSHNVSTPVIVSTTSQLVTQEYVHMNARTLSVGGWVGSWVMEVFSALAFQLGFQCSNILVILVKWKQVSFVACAESNISKVVRMLFPSSLLYFGSLLISQFSLLFIVERGNNYSDYVQTSFLALGSFLFTLVYYADFMWNRKEFICLDMLHVSRLHEVRRKFIISIPAAVKNIIHACILFCSVAIIGWYEHFRSTSLSRNYVSIFLILKLLLITAILHAQWNIIDAVIASFSIEGDFLNLNDLADALDDSDYFQALGCVRLLETSVKLPLSAWNSVGSKVVLLLKVFNFEIVSWIDPERVKNFTIINPAAIPQPSKPATITTIKRPFASLYENPTTSTISMSTVVADDPSLKTVPLLVFAWLKQWYIAHLPFVVKFLVYLRSKVPHTIVRWWNAVYEISPSESRINLFSKFAQFSHLVEGVGFALENHLAQSADGPACFEQLLEVWISVEEFMISYNQKFAKNHLLHPLHFKAPMTLLFHLENVCLRLLQRYKTNQINFSFSTRVCEKLKNVVFDDFQSIS